MKSILSTITVLALVVVLAGCGNRSASTVKTDDSLKRVQEAGVLYWGADVIGGIPFVYEDADNPGTYIGFEMDIAHAVAKELGVKAQLVIKAWDTLVPELQASSFDMAMNGIEDTEERGRIVGFSNPYFVYSQQITVRNETNGITKLEDLVGKKVATLSGTAAEDILRGTSGIQVVTNPEIIYSYDHLEEGKVDAVLLDTPIAAAYGATNPKLKNVGQSFGEGRYVIAFRGEDQALLNAVNEALETLKRSGELKAIYKKFGIMDQHQNRIGVL